MSFYVCSQGKTVITTLCYFIGSILCLGGCANTNKPDSLLKILDKTIADRDIYAQQKEKKVWDLKQRKATAKSLDELFHINSDIIRSYESYNYDSTEFYICQNIEIAKQLGNESYLSFSYLKLFYIYSLSGLFVQAEEICQLLNFDSLPPDQKPVYCWNFIRYYENLIKYTDDPKLTNSYVHKIEECRNMLMQILPVDSEEYRKEYAFRLQQKGEFDEILNILTDIHNRQDSETHSYAMVAMSLAKVYRLKGDWEQEEKFLKLAAITDVRLAVKENESLLRLATNLFERGDTERAYNYITAALSDANFFNSRFKNTVIARVHPIIEANYLRQIGEQSRHLRLYALFISLFVIVLGITLYINYNQVRIVTKARRNLRIMNEKLTASNRKLDEANLIKEKYIGYFMNKCAIYINKLDEYRKNVNHKIKNGQADSLYKPSTRELEKDIEELCVDFDGAFLKLYPDFVEEFNSLLRPGEQLVPEPGRLNAELRIFALMRLGITDVNHISVFLHYSVQTIYNYKSKVKSKSLLTGDQFEEAVKKTGSLLQ